MPLTSAKTKYEHVILDEKGVPIITGTNATCCPAEIRGHWCGASGGGSPGKLYPAGITVACRQDPSMVFELPCILERHNVNLIRLPDELIDYISLYELVHIRVKDHSKRFWNELESRF